MPWALTGWDDHDAPVGIRVVGALLTAVGALVVIHSFARFVVEGLGTPAPVAPPRRLVVGGLYRHVRNPMYVALVSAIVGQTLLFGRPLLLAYAAAVGVAFVAFVRWYEEPTLARRFGGEYDAYRRAVPGWWPRLRPWRGPPGGGPRERG